MLRTLPIRITVDLQDPIQPYLARHADACGCGAQRRRLGGRHVDAVETASEEAIVAAMRRIWEVLKIIIEPSCAVPYAAILEGKIPVAGLRVGIILTGGNVDLDALPWLKK